MQVLSINLGGAGSGADVQAFDIAGRYFEILESTGPVTVAFYDANGSRSSDLELRRVDSGFYVVGAFSRFELVNEWVGGAQTVRVAYGSGTGGSRRQPGSVVIVDAIGERVQTISTGIVTVGMAQVETLVPASSNTAGIVLRAAAVAVRAGAAQGAQSQLNVVASKQVSPTTTVGTQRILLAGCMDNAGVNRTISDFDLCKRLPAGWGIYAIRDITGVPAGDATTLICYELL